MGMFDFIGNAVNTIGEKIKSGAQWLGDKASQAASFIGDKVQKALPTVGAIAQGVSDVANVVAPYMPVGGDLVKSIGKAGQFVADKVRDGTVNNKLERVKTGLADVQDFTKKFN